MSEPQAQPNAAQPTNGAAPPSPELADFEVKAKYAKMLAASDEGEGEPAPPPAPEPKKPAPKAAAKVEAEAESEDDAGTDRPGDTGLVRELRNKLREQKRKNYEKLQTERGEVAKQRAELKAVADWKAQIDAALAAGDDDQVIKLIYEMDLNAFQKRQVDKVRGRDPRLDAEIRRREALEKKLAEDAETKAKADEEARIEQERHEHKLGLTRELVQHSDPTVAKLAEVREFIEGLHLPGVFDAQAETFDGEEYATAEEAVERVLPQWRAVYAALHQFFGDQDASNPADPAKGSTDRSGLSSAKPPAPAGKKKAIAQGKAAEASPTNGRVDEVALKQRYAQRLASAED